MPQPQLFRLAIPALTASTKTPAVTEVSINMEKMFTKHGDRDDLAPEIRAL
jgi:hypothetical protein